MDADLRRRAPHARGQRTLTEAMQSTAPPPLPDGYRELAPSAAARSLIACFWVFAHRYARPTTERVVPDGNVDFVIHATHRPMLTLAGRTFRKPAPFTGGQLIHGGRLALDGTVVMFGVRFHAWVAPLLYRVPVDMVNDDRVSVHELVGADIRTRYDELVNEVGEGNYAHVMAVLELLILRWRRPATVTQRLVELAMRRQQAVHGAWLLSAAARSLAISERYLQRAFREERGMTFKYYARLLRVSTALRLRLHDPTRGDLRLGALAHAAGYYDQAHQARDFRAIVGCSPSEFFREDNHYVTELHQRSG